jgi:hypothetical protein
MKKKDRFKKQPTTPTTPFDKWLKDQGFNMRPVRSWAHAIRMLYAGGMSKAHLQILCTQQIATHLRMLRRLRRIGDQPGDLAVTRKQKLQQWRDALDEVKGLPDDPPPVEVE